MASADTAVVGAGGGHRLPSIRRLVVWIVCVPVVVACAVLVGIAVGANRRVAGELRNQLLEEAGTSVAEKTRLYLGEAVQVSDLYARRLGEGRLSTSAFAGWEPAMMDDLATHPRVASICFGNADGAAVWLQRRGGRLELGLAPGGTETRAVEYAADLSVGRVERGTALREYEYDPRRRPWYGLGAEAGEGVWTPVYAWVGGPTKELAVGFTRAIRDKGGRLVGVLVVDVTPGALGDYLRRLPVAQRGRVYVVDEGGMVVAASDGEVFSKEGERVAAAKGVLGTGFQARRIKGWDGGAAWVTVAPLSPSPGLNWRVVTVLPEAAFMGPVEAMQRNSAVLAVACGVGALLLGLRLSGRLTGPLVKLAGHVRRVGRGDFESRLELGGARELREVAGEVNKMAAGLRERVALEQSMALAAHVQKSLLPAGPPVAAGVEVAGQSRYCDATGGDYYDFIDVRQMPAGDGVLIAVGDVMGHGIGAAMLMATARAALRAAAGSARSLGELMGCVNRVLAEDARHGLFMTMALVHVDARAGRIRWASAGHDPTIVYDSRTGVFEELEGGDVPLGVTEGVEYEEYERAFEPAGQVLVVGTDGIWEARDERDEMFGKERLREAIRGAAGGSAGEVAEAIEKALGRFVGNAKVLDDVTFVVVRMQGDKAAGVGGDGAAASGGREAARVALPQA